MPLAYEIDGKNRVVIIKGEYARADAWRTLLGEVLVNPEYRPGMSFLRDLRGSAQPVDAQTVMAIIEVVKEHWEALGAHRAAILMSSNHDAPALIAHALADIQHLPLRAFNNYDEALAWLKEK